MIYLAEPGAAALKLAAVAGVNAGDPAAIAEFKALSKRMGLAVDAAPPAAPAPQP